MNKSYFLMVDWTITSHMTIPQLDFFLIVIKDLTRINSGQNDNVVCRINNDQTLLYSYVGKTVSDILAFKNYIIPTNSIFTFKKEFNTPFNFVIRDAKKFVRNISNYKDYQNDISLKFQVEEKSSFVNVVNINNNKLKIRVTGGDPISLNNDISIEVIQDLLDTRESYFNFDINVEDFAKIKKMSTVDIKNDVLYLKTENGRIILGENKWELDIADTGYKDLSISFPKKYFNAINVKKTINVSVFENHILLTGDNSNLMIVLEFTV